MRRKFRHRRKNTNKDRLINQIIVPNLEGKIPDAEIQKIQKLWEYVGDFLLIATQFLFAVHIHSKGNYSKFTRVKLTLENAAMF